MIGNVEYVIVAEEMEGAKNTQWEIISGLIERHLDEQINKRTYCLNTNGGKKVC